MSIDCPRPLVKRPAFVLAAVILLSSCDVVQVPATTSTALGSMAATPEVQFLASEEQQALNLPFSEAVRVGSMLYLSGQIGNLPGTLTLAEGGIQAETRQAMENIADVLERYGSSLDRVVKCLVMVDDMEEWPLLNEVYVEFFPEHKPARSAMGADGLALGARAEIECMATIG